MTKQPVKNISEKTAISKALGKLRDFGFIVITFNSNKRFGRGMTGFVDHFIIAKGNIFFIEVKLKGDVMSEPQKKLRDALIKIEERMRMENIQYTHYIQLNDLDQAKEFTNDVLKGAF